MKPEKQRITIAKACGWEHIVFNRGWIKAGDDKTQCVIPDYLNDLNAIHEAENNLEKMDKAEFSVQLCRVAGKDWPNGIGGGSFIHIHATASQRAEAFLKTLKLWTE